ncbi:DEAD/DEAH box helicase [Cerasicoccus frondis]|uniref:DEAD/DEAH box helicase n=1 Tax=Cerasicoccus frondis TaxID=490090 RepID=UPI00285296AB|nr:DEAD/DEAH box helicase [Cerasicoccus frondis]
MQTDMFLEAPEDDGLDLPGPEEVARSGGPMYPRDRSRITLRPYQYEALDATLRGFQVYRSQLLNLVTGGGKTIIFSHATEWYVNEHQWKVLILADRDELLQQARDKLAWATGIRAGLEKAQSHASRYDEVVVSSVQTLAGKKRLAEWARDHFQLIIVDEADLSIAPSYDRIFDHFASAKILGVTGTIDRGDNKSLGRRYQQVAYEYSILDAVQDGHLCRPVVKTVPLPEVKLPDGQKFNSQKALDAFTAESIKPLLSAIARALITESEGRKTIVFLPNVEVSDLLTRELNEIEPGCSDWVAGDKKRCPDRKQRIARFMRREYRILCNAQLVVRGFDDTDVACVCILRPTKVRSMYVQCVGRATRLLPGVTDGLATAQERRTAIAQSAKPNCLILDFLWLSDRLNLVQPAHIVTGNPRVANQMARKDGDLIENEEEAEREVAKAMLMEVQKNAKKRGRLFDPLEKATELGIDEIRDFKPANSWEARPPTIGQIDKLVEAGVNPDCVPNFGAAALIIRKAEQRKSAGLATFRQVQFLQAQNVEGATHYSREDATKYMRRRFSKFKGNKRKGAK